MGVAPAGGRVHRSGRNFLQVSRGNFASRYEFEYSTDVVNVYCNVCTHHESVPVDWQDRNNMIHRYYRRY